MIIIAELIDVFNEYRNGNKKIFDTLYRDNISKDGLDYGANDLKINDVGLNHCIYGWYEYFRQHCKFSKKSKCPKFNEQVFSGSVEDLKQIVLLELYKLCKDRNFAPETNHDIYAKLKYNTMKILGIDIAVSAYAESDIRIDENGEEYSLFEEYSLLEDYLNANEIPENILFRNPKYKYIGIMAEIVELLRKHDVKSLLKRNDADTQCRIIDLIYKYYNYIYDENTDEINLPDQNKMLEYYKYEYGESITQDIYSRALNHIFKSIMELTTSFIDRNINRSDFTKETKNEIYKL